MLFDSSSVEDSSFSDELATSSTSELLVPKCESNTFVINMNLMIRNINFACFFVNLSFQASVQNNTILHASESIV